LISCNSNMARYSSWNVRIRSYSIAASNCIVMAQDDSFFGEGDILASFSDELPALNIHQTVIRLVSSTALPAPFQGSVPIDRPSSPHWRLLALKMTRLRNGEISTVSQGMKLVHRPPSSSLVYASRSSTPEPSSRNCRFISPRSAARAAI
jgi:hypothetical protein